MRTSPTIRPRSLTSDGGRELVADLVRLQGDVDDVDEALLVGRDAQADEQRHHQQEHDPVDPQHDLLADAGAWVPSSA